MGEEQVNAEEKWAEKQEWRQERKCPKFPDCSCAECHASHEEPNEFCDSCRDTLTPVNP